MVTKVMSSCPEDWSASVVSLCRAFDFTIWFEQIVLSALPAIAFCLLSLIRCPHLFRQEIKARSGVLLHFKLAFATLFLVAQICNLISWATLSFHVNVAWILPGIFRTAGALFIAGITYLEHRRSVRPSSLLCIYLAFTALFDVPLVRTLWLVKAPKFLAASCSASIGVKALLLIVELQSKKGYLLEPYNLLPPEAISGTICRSFFWWLTPLFIRGSKSILSLHELWENEEAISSRRLKSKLESQWARQKKRGRYPLVIAVFFSLRRALLSAMFPRLCQTAFTYVQPLLINRIITFVSAGQSGSSANTGYGLIAATGLAYTGLALSVAKYKYYIYRTITTIRGSLIGLIYDKTLRLDQSNLEDGAAITLMSTDIDRIASGLQNFHELWASPLDLSIAIFLLQREIGVACVMPISLAIVCTFCSSRIAQFTGGRQKLWNDAVQERVSVTSSVLEAVRGVKMTGIGEQLMKTIQDLRIKELDWSAHYRTLSVYMNLVANFSTVMAPTFTFLVYLLMHKGSPLTAAQAFTTLSVISLLTTPLASILNSLPMFTSALGCFARIQNHLLREERDDPRQLLEQANSNPSQDFQQSSDMLSGAQMTEKVKYDIQDSLVQSDIESRTGSAIVTKDASFGYKVDQPAIVWRAGVSIPRGGLTAVIGPNGCGKSIFLKGLLGEAPLLEGSVHTFSTNTAYCSQDPWLVNGSIRDNILGGSLFDDKWYKSVLRVCSLDEEIGEMPNNDLTIVGSKGAALSGGQRQRISLARAVYARSKILLLDDVLRGLDKHTERVVFDRLLGLNGVLRHKDTTVVLVTQAAHYAPFADHIIAFGEDGHIEEQGKPDQLRSSSRFAPLFKGEGQWDDNDDSPPEQPAGSRHQQSTGAESQHDNVFRQTGDVTVYKYYAKSIGPFFALLFTLNIIIYVFSYKFPQIWLSWWTSSRSIKTNNEKSLFLGVYGGLSATALISFSVSIWFMFIIIVPKSASRLHWQLLASIMRAPYSFFTTTDAGVTLNRFSQDMSLIDMELPSAVLEVLMDIGTCLIQAIFIATSSKYIASTIPVCLVFVYLLQKAYLRTSRQLRFLDLEAKSPLYTNMLDTYSGIVSIRAFGWQKQYQELNLNLLDMSQRPYYLLYLSQRWLNLVLDLMVAALAVLLVSFVVTIKDSPTGGSVGVGLLNILSLSQNLASLIRSWTLLETSLGAIARVKEVVDNTPNEDAGDLKQDPPAGWPGNGSICFRGVSARYNGDYEATSAIRDVTFDIPPGGKLAIVGKSGSGKSTLLSVLTRLLPISTGTITIADEPVSCLRADTIRSAIISIPQDSLLLPGTLRFNLDPHGKPRDNEELETALQKVGLWPIVQKKGGLDEPIKAFGFSHGQRQLFGLARAMIQKGRVVVMDEATSALTLDTEVRIQRLIREEWASTIMIVVAHHLEGIVDFDKVIVMDKGVIVEKGVPRELLEDEGSYFSQLWGGRK